MNPITPSQMQLEDPLKTPVVTDSTDYTSLLNNSLSTVQSDFTTAQTRQAQAENKQAGTAGDINQVLSYLEGKDTYTTQAQTDAGVNKESENVLKLSEQLGGLNAQASGLQREAQAIPLQLQQESAGKGLTSAGIAPIETARLRDNAIRSLSIAQQADIAQASLTGSKARLALAQDKAQQMVDLKYKPQETKLATLQAQYKANQDYLERVDKNLADTFANKLKIEGERIKLAKENEQDIQKLIVNASSQGADSDIVQRASKAKTPMQAAMILGAYSGDYLQTQKLKAEIARINSETAKNYTKGGVVDTTGLKTLSSTELSKFNALPQVKDIANAVPFRQALSDYKSAIGKWGTGELFGQGSGEINEPYQRLVGAIKDYYKLGSLDNGVQKLVSLGIPEPSILGQKSGRVASLDSAITAIDKDVENKFKQVESTGYKDSVEYAQIKNQYMGETGKTGSLSVDDYINNIGSSLNTITSGKITEDDYINSLY
jgi:hypothetical protein